LVDDDEDLRTTLAEQLNLYDEFEAFEAPTGLEGLALTKENTYDLVLLDVGLPDHDGREICRMMRHNGVKLPIIMLTGADTDADTILGLVSGANDYVTKPFRFPLFWPVFVPICVSTSNLKMRFLLLALIPLSPAPNN
jgi:DNA-binding response OmpR family regulator